MGGDEGESLMHNVRGNRISRLRMPGSALLYEYGPITDHPALNPGLALVCHFDKNDITQGREIVLALFPRRDFISNLLAPLF